MHDMGIRFVTFCFILSGGLLSFGQSKTTSGNLLPGNTYNIQWTPPSGQSRTAGATTPSFLNFKGAQYSFYDGFLPRYYENVPVEPGSRSLTARLVNALYAPLSSDEEALVKDP